MDILMEGEIHMCEYCKEQNIEVSVRAFQGSDGIMFDKTIEEIIAIDGVNSCREESEGTYYENSILDEENM